MSDPFTEAVAEVHKVLEAAEKRIESSAAVKDIIGALHLVLDLIDHSTTPTEGTALTVPSDAAPDATTPPAPPAPPAAGTQPAE